MSGPRDSILKRWHALTISPRKCRECWREPYWKEADGFRDIACRDCRKFDVAEKACSVPFGTPSRKCAVAAIEANLSDAPAGQVLEIGFGRWALARNLVRRNGGTWTGIDPGQPEERGAALGRGGYGLADDLPFPDAAFELVYGIQTFEHWGQKVSSLEPADYGDCLREIWRVMKPDARLYLDAPLHYHGHEMFIMGDVPRLRALFDDVLWADITMERWRRDHGPLEPFLPPPRVREEWPVEIVSYPEDEISAALDGASAWLLTFKARKRP